MSEALAEELSTFTSGYSKKDFSGGSSSAHASIPTIELKDESASTSSQSPRGKAASTTSYTQSLRSSPYSTLSSSSFLSSSGSYSSSGDRTTSGSSSYYTYAGPGKGTSSGGTPHSTATGHSTAGQRSVVRSGVKRVKDGAKCTPLDPSRNYIATINTYNRDGPCRVIRVYTDKKRINFRSHAPNVATSARSREGNIVAEPAKAASSCSCAGKHIGHVDKGPYGTGFGKRKGALLKLEPNFGCIKCVHSKSATSLSRGCMGAPIIGCCTSLHGPRIRCSQSGLMCKPARNRMVPTSRNYNEIHVYRAII